MARAKSPSVNRYEFPGVDPDDRTLGGAIPPELFDRLNEAAPAAEQPTGSDQ